MLVEAVARREPQLGLNAMEQPVKHIAGVHRQSCPRAYKGGLNHRNPPQSQGRPRNQESSWLPLRFNWLVARVPVAWSKITTGPERHTPQPARSLAGFVASRIALSELRLDLCIRGRCGAKQLTAAGC
jgi:hypothetical protein